MTPFDAKLLVGRKGIINYIMNMPPNLQQIIAEYIEEYSGSK